uniref:Uncharacterized protein n=1 Tax=Oryza glumipatula TaxID=40148 RepID=A0A0E0BA15_9ORYZ
MSGTKVAAACSTVWLLAKARKWLEVPADDAPQSLTLLLCRGSGSGGGGSVAGLIAWSSRTPSLRSCSRSVSTLSVPSASWTVVGVGAVTLVVFADVVVALDLVAHTHTRRVQMAASEEHGCRGCSGRRARRRSGDGRAQRWAKQRRAS